MRVPLHLSAACALFTLLHASHAAVPLPQLNIDTSQTTVSGLSAGGFMPATTSYFRARAIICRTSKWCMRPGAA